MSRVINLGAAQMGPIAPDESRKSCVSRMVDLIKRALEGAALSFFLNSL